MMDNRLRVAGEAFLLLLLSLVMAEVGLASLIAVTPLLFFSIRHGRIGASILIAGAFILELVIAGFRGGAFGAGKLGAAVLMIEMFIPLSLSAAGIVWLSTKGMSVMKRLFMTLLPSLVLALACVAFFYSDRALLTDLQLLFEDAFAALVGPVLELILPGVDMSLIAYVALLSVVSLVLPVILCGICASCFIYETVLHSRESDWEEKVMCLEYNPDAVWGFIVSWALVLLLRFVSAPLLLEIAVLNVAGIWTVVYAVQGFSVVFARLRRRSAAMRSMTLLIIVIVLTVLLPGINFIILIGLPLIGVLESFFDLKKLGGIDYENHS